MNGFYNFETSKLMPNEHHTMLKMSSSSNYAKLIEVRIEFLTFGEVDTMNEKFQAEVRVRSRWYDDEDIDIYDKTKHWYPKLFIENALHDVKEEISYQVDKLNDKSIITEIRIAKGSFWERIELQNFPIDIQELSITLASRYKPNRVKLVADSQKISTIRAECLNTFRDQQKWKLYKIVKVSESASYDLGSATSLTKSNSGSEFHEIKINKHEMRSKLVATCYCSRRPGYFLINCYSFIFLITVLSLTLFAFETSRTQNRIAGTFTLILTSVSFKWVTNRFLPAISYMTSLDRYQIISIMYLCLCCVWHSTISSIDLENSTKIIVDKIAVCLFALLFSSIQIIISIGIIKAIQKVKVLKKSESNFISQYGNEDSDDDDY